MTPVSTLKFICFSGAASPFLNNQNVLASSILSTVMEDSATSSTGSSPPNSVFCSKYEIHTDSEKKPWMVLAKNTGKTFWKNTRRKVEMCRRGWMKWVANLGQLLKYRWAFVVFVIAESGQFRQRYFEQPLGCCKLYLAVTIPTCHLTDRNRQWVVMLLARSL